jgi:hypothetical protein
MKCFCIFLMLEIFCAEVLAGQKLCQMAAEARFDIGDVESLAFSRRAVVLGFI